MQTERFKIKNADSVEIEIMVLTEDNVINPDVPYSYPFKSIEYGHQNYAEINKLLSDLIQRGILMYEKQEGNEQVFKHIVGTNSNEFKYERVSIGPAIQPEEAHSLGSVLGNPDLRTKELRAPLVKLRTLENMLYTVCQAHNIPAPAIIRPKNMFTALYNRVMYPATPDDEIQSAVVTTLSIGTMAVCCGITLAMKFRS